MTKHISPRQLYILCFVAMLSPFLRLVPGSVVEWAGKAGWVSAALSIVPAAVLGWMLGKFSTKGGLQVEIFRILGPFGGSLLLLLMALWLVFHSGFVLRSGAERFIDTIYPASGPELFIGITAVICAVAAMGHIRPMARVSELFLPMMVFVIGLVILFSLKDMEPCFLLPITPDMTGDALAGVPLAAEAVSVALLLWAMGAKFLTPGAPLGKLWPGLALVTVMNVLVCVVAIGNLGPVYTGTLEYPGFILARDLSILSGVERVEALIVGLWLLPDFVLVTLELILAADCLEMVFRRSVSNECDATTSQSPEATAPLCKGSRGDILFLSLAAVGFAFFIAPVGADLRQLSTKIVPAFQLGWAYIVIPLLFLIGKLRRKF